MRNAFMRSLEAKCDARNCRPPEEIDLTLQQTIFCHFMHILKIRDGWRWKYVTTVMDLWSAAMWDTTLNRLRPSFGEMYLQLMWWLTFGNGISLILQR